MQRMYVDTAERGFQTSLDCSVSVHEVTEVAESESTVYVS